VSLTGNLAGLLIHLNGKWVTFEKRLIESFVCASVRTIQGTTCIDAQLEDEALITSTELT